MRRGLLLLAVALVLCSGVGGLVYYFRDREAKTVVVPLEEVPEPLLKKAQATLPDVKFDHARRLPNGNYEIRGKARNGKVREVELKPSGEIVEIE